MARWDVESFLDELKTYLQANLNTKIAAINTEKGDSLLSTLANDAYLIQDLESKTMTYDPFVIMGVVDVETIPTGPLTAKIYTIDVIMILQQQNNSDNYKRLFRYQRALEDVFDAGWNSINHRVKIELESLVPGFALVSVPQQHRAIGMGLRVTIT